MMVAHRLLEEVGVPTLLRVGPYRFLIHSREHLPPHVHVRSNDGEATFTLFPVELHDSKGYTRRQIREIYEAVLVNQHEFLRRWYEHFSQ